MAQSASPHRVVSRARGKVEAKVRNLHERGATFVRTHGTTVALDAVIVAWAYLAAEATRFDASIPQIYLGDLLVALPFVVLTYSIFHAVFTIHQRAWQYAGLEDVRALLDASMLSVLTVLSADVVLGTHRPLPVSAVLVGGVFAFAGLVIVRIWPRLMHAPEAHRPELYRVLIVGAGQAGHLLAADLHANPSCAQTAAGFLDDDARKTHMRIHGVPVLGTTEDLPDVVRKHRIDTVAIAIPSASTRTLDRILALAQETDARIQVVPSQAEVLAGRSSSLRLRDIDLDTLLDRIPSTEALQGSLIRETIEGRVALVTGAAGSIGSEICRQLTALGAAQVLALDNNETGLFHLERELAEFPTADVLVPILTSVTAGPKLRQVFERYRPDLVFHAAAYKHVPMLEQHADEAVFVNVKGTLNVCQCAAEFGCSRMVFVSTDKAVQPVNTLGYTKRIGELLVRAHAQRYPETVFCSVRFGNVIGSRGSALPEFIRQIERGGPVTVTHAEVERYFMTIPEAVSLVIQAGALARGGELFMLDMGHPIKIGELVERLIRLHGLRVGQDIQIVYTGLRPGEKLTEDLVFDAEQTFPTEVPSIHALRDGFVPDLEYLEAAVEMLVRMAIHDDVETMLGALALAASGQPLTGRPALRSVHSIGAAHTA